MKNQIVTFLLSSAAHLLDMFAYRLTHKHEIAAHLHIKRLRPDQKHNLLTHFEE